MAVQVPNNLMRLYFRLKMYRSSGMDFQIFFSNIMGYLDQNFVPIKPYGNWGDGGNDGYNPASKHYYQIYAPLATTTPRPLDELNKAVTDYEKLETKWGEINGYSFVINDKFTNIPALLQNDFESFKQQKNIQQGQIIHAQKLQSLFMSLTDDQKLDVLELHCLDEGDNTEFEPTIISELITHLIENNENCFNFLDGEAPDFDEKVIFNKLNPILAAKLTSKYAEVFKIDEFLAIQDDGMAQDLALCINSIYKDINRSIPTEDVDRNALIYLGLIESLVPEHAKNNKLTKRGYTSVAEIIIAKYFSTCDVYEDPNSTIAS